MPKRRKAPNPGAKPPRAATYCLHRANGQAYVKIGGRVVYGGVHGSAESREAYVWAVARVANKVGVLHWTPNQLRHTAGTEVRAEFGLEAAQTILGHATAKMTEHYAEKHLAAVAEVAWVLG